MTTVAVFAAAGVLDLLMPQPQVAEIRPGFAELGTPVCVRTGAVPGAPSETADEAYVLDVSPTGVTVVAATSQGERYAHVTLEQLKDLSGGRLPCCRIVDWPRLRWRGFMNDCGKNFLEVEGIKAILDVMVAYKMNLFHWHLTDYQGWRLESKKYPQLQKPESFTRQIGRFYTQDEFRDIVAYAKERGITVMPELDVPGHTLAFRRAMGIDSMSAKGTDGVVADLFRELCSLADEKTMPFIHLGTDEARLDSERCSPEWPNLWARAVNRCGRKAVVWAPGIRLAKDIDSIEMAWHDAYVTNAVSPVIDASRMYHASWDPFDVLSHVAFTRPCRWTETNAQQLGAVTCCWHDDNMGDDTMKRFRECMMIPSIVGFAENYWTGRNEDRPEFIKRLPSPGTPAFAFAEALERRMVAQRDKVIAKRWPSLPFPFVGQSRMRWSVRDGESGKLLATDVPQATVWAYNERAKGNALIPEPCGGVVFETWVKSPEDRTVGCWIDCVKVHGEYGRDGVARLPGRGEWSAEGAEVLVNGEAVAPPEWKQPGLSAKEKIDVLERDVPYMNDLLETPMVDEMFALRPPIPVRFRKGWNHVAVRLPKKAKRLRASTGMTFCPIMGTSEHPREVEDFEYSATPPLHAFVQLWGDNLIRGHDTGRSFRDIPVSDGHFYHVRTTPKVDGVCRFMNAGGEVAGEVRLSERDAFYSPFGATAAELTLAANAEVRFYEDPEPPKTPVPDPNTVSYDDRPQGLPTDRWQREIDAVAEKGGGVVRVPSGVWHTKPLLLRSNVTLELDDGTVLLASVDPLDYNPEPRRRAFIYAEDATNVTIRGKGTLDGRGYAFKETGKNMDGASQPQTLPKLMCFNRCRNVTLEGFTYRRGGAWGCHLCNCDGVTMRRVTCFNHVNNTNDGIDIESRNVLIEDCDIDADDDAIAVKSESDKSFAVTNIIIRNCRLASMAYPFKIGTGSYGDVRDVLVENCTFPRTKMNHRFPWSKLVAGITNDISGICGIGIQCVDGGRLENIVVRNIDIEGYGVPLAIRLGRRHQPEPGKATGLRNVLIENVKAVAEGPAASSIVGADGLEVEDVTLRNVRIKLAGGATAADVGIVYPNDKGYPSPNMFRSILPACGLFTRHASRVVLDNVGFELAGCDARPIVDGPAFTLLKIGPDVAPTNRIVRRVDPAPITIPRFADDLKALGTGGLTSVDGHSGSFAFLAVVEPKTRRGVVAGWLTNEKASGVIQSGFDADGNIVISPFAEYGRMEVPANAEVRKDLFVYGFFDDCRKGLEQYAELVAAHYGISLPRQIAGYTTWYDDVHGYSHREGAGTAASAKAFADAAVRRNLKAYGFDFYQIDDFWQSGRTDINGPARDFFHVNPKGPFPDGFNGTTAYLAERGIISGLWTMPFGGLSAEPFFADKQDIFATAAETMPGSGASAKSDAVGIAMAQTAGRPFETAWGGTIIDLTKPSGQKYVADLCRLITREWGFRYVKFDGMWTGHGGDLLGGATWRNDHYDNIVRADMTKTGVEAFRAGVETMREACAQGTFLLACNSAQNPRSIAASYGLVDGMRIGGDNGPIDEFPDRYLNGPVAATPRYFYNGRVWYNDPDPIYVRDAVPLNRARLFASWGGISGLLYNFSDWLPNLSDGRVELLKRTMAPHGIKACRPVDYFENLTSHVWEVGEGACKVFGLFNWKTNKTLKVDYPAAYCGLDPQKTYVAFDFWRNEFVPPFKGNLSFEVPADDCMVIAVHELSVRPFVLSTSRHVASPLFDVREEHWDAATRTLSGVSHVVPGEEYEIRIVADGRLVRRPFRPAASPFAWRVVLR